METDHHDVPPALAVRGCSKAYPGVRALHDVSLTVAAGEVRGLVGQNGAGKSTLIKIIAGAVLPDDGTVQVAGSTMRGGVAEHRAAGIAVIYQEPQLVPHMSALENVFLGATPRSRLGTVRWSAMKAEYEAMCAELGVRIDANARAASLSPGDRQLVEIMRALRAASAVLILDEPTTALPERERERLYRVMEQVRGRGTAIVFISHDLDDVLSNCETVTVLKDGRNVTTERAGDLDPDRLVSLMTGDAHAEIAPPSTRRRGEELLSVRALSVLPTVRSVSITAHAGEVVGLAGLLGSGRTETLRALAGADHVTTGRLWLRGHEVKWPTTVRRAKKLGIQLSPEDRRHEGLVGDLSASANVTLGSLGALPWWKPVSKSVEKAQQRQVLDDVGLARGRESSPVRNLSGGNQQKVLLARLLIDSPDVVLLDEPTSGIDVAAKAQILELAVSIAASGKAMVVAMSDLQEMLTFCDRVYVLRGGETVAERDSRTTSEEEILQLTFAGEGRPAC